MTYPDHSFTATITGLIAGFVVSIPVGPINLTIINEGARKGFKWAIMIGLGSVLMESIYCAIALTGFSAFLLIPVVKAAMELLSFLFLLFLSWRFFSAKTIPSHVHSADVIEQKFHPRNAFTVGFVRVLGNPSVLLLWATLTATFLAHNWVDETLDDRIGCVLGVASGATMWFLLLSWGVSKGHGKFSPRVLLRIEHISGAIMLAAALWIGGRIVSQLHQQHLHKLRHPAAQTSTRMAFCANANVPLHARAQGLGCAPITLCCSAASFSLALSQRQFTPSSRSPRTAR